VERAHTFYIYINYYSPPAMHMEATVKDKYGGIMK
jgi:hypothetical protein